MVRQLVAANKDLRPAMFFEYASGIRLNSIDAQIDDQASSFIRLKDVKDVFLRDCKPEKADIPFMLVEGKSDGITALSNDFSRVKKGVENHS